MKFVLAGFRQTENIRFYSFQGIGEDRRTRTEFRVGIDLTLLHKHGIPLQEAPLLCSLLLASRGADEQLRSSMFSECSLMFSEDDMLAHAERRARELAETHNDRKPKPSSPTQSRTLPSPIVIDSPQRPSDIGLGSRLGSALS
jgi:hypothetical protein